MAVVQQLSVVAVRSLFEGFCRSIGFEAGAAASEAAVKFPAAASPTTAPGSTPRSSGPRQAPGER
jgi:hypothetical protein